MRPALLLSALLLTAVPAAAQETAAGAAQEPAAPRSTPVTGPPEVTAAIALAEEGKMREAAAALEPLRQRDELTPPIRALLGALLVEAGEPLDALEVLAPIAERDDANPAVLYNAGRAALTLNRAAAAQGYLERAVGAAPGSPAARELGLLYARQGRFVDAFLQLKPWARANPEDLLARRVAALCAVQLERATDAEELLSDLPQDEPSTRLLWGKLLLLKADPWGALATLQPLLDSAPPEMALDVRRSLAEAHAAVGEAAKAVEVLEGHVGQNPSVALQLGQAQYQSGDLDGAVATLKPFAERLLEAAENGTPPRPGFERALVVEQGRLLVTAGRHAEALPYLELATRVDPADKQSWHQLGQALAAAGRREEAAAALERFQEIVQNEVPASVEEVQLAQDLGDPTGRELRKAMTLLAKGQGEEALAIVQREAALAPEDIRPRLVEVRILHESDDLDTALEAADLLVEQAPESADAVYLRGIVHMGRMELEPAERDLRRALELSAEHTAAMNDLAVLLIERGDTAEARTLLERALAIRPGDRLAAANLARIQEGE